jgi:hypothetical protein
VQAVKMAKNSIEMDITKSFHRPSIQGAAKVAKRERTFELSLPALVSGINAIGRDFEEGTQVLSISAQEASFHLNSRLLIGTKITLSLEIPKTLILENQLRLFLTGTVTYVRAESGKDNSQFICIRLDKNYKLQPFRPNLF